MNNLDFKRCVPNKMANYSHMKMLQKLCLPWSWCKHVYLHSPLKLFPMLLYNRRARLFNICFFFHLTSTYIAICKKYTLESLASQGSPSNPSQNELDQVSEVKFQYTVNFVRWKNKIIQEKTIIIRIVEVQSTRSLCVLFLF